MCQIQGRNMTKIRKRYNQVPHPSQDTTWESDKNILNITNKSQRSALSQQVTTKQQCTNAKACKTQDINQKWGLQYKK